MSDKTGAYAAAELGSKLRGEDPGDLVRSFAGWSTTSERCDC